MAKNKTCKGRKPFYATKEAFIKDITSVSKDICKGMAPTVSEMASAIKKSPVLVQNYINKFELGDLFASGQRGRQNAFDSCDNFKKVIAKTAKKYRKVLPAVSDVMKATGWSETTIRKYASSFGCEDLLKLNKRSKKVSVKKEYGRVASHKPGNRIVGMTAETFEKFILMVTADLGRKPTLAEATAYLNEALAANGCTVEKTAGAVSFYANKFGLTDLIQSCSRGRKAASKDDMYSLIGSMLG